MENTTELEITDEMIEVGAKAVRDWLEDDISHSLSEIISRDVLLAALAVRARHQPKAPAAI